MEVTNEVKTINIDYKCDKCNEGYMRPTGTVFPTNPPQIPHKCNNSLCNESKTFNLYYPYIDYKPIDN
jgi:hypothetical protein